MSRLERALLTSVMLITTAVAGCAADGRAEGEDRLAEGATTDEAAADVEQAASELLKRWGGDDHHDGGDTYAPCDGMDGGDCKDDGWTHDEECKDGKGDCEERCDRKKVRKVCFFKTILTGLEEVPVRETLAFGAAVFKYDSKRRKLDYWLYVANLRNVVAAHLHLGARGVNGPVVAFLAGPFPPGGGFFSGELASGAIGRDDLLGPLEGESVKTLVEALASGDIYVNVHTDDGVTPADTGSGDFASGEIRGQVKKLGCKFAKKKDHDCKTGEHCKDEDHHGDHQCKPDHEECKGHECKPDHEECKGHECKPDHEECKEHECKPDHEECEGHDCKPDHHDCPDGDHGADGDHAPHEWPTGEMM